MKKITGSVFLCFSLLSASEDRWVEDKEGTFWGNKRFLYYPKGEFKLYSISVGPETKDGTVLVSYFASREENQEFTLTTKQRDFLVNYITTKNPTPSTLLYCLPRGKNQQSQEPPAVQTSEDPQ